VGLGFESRPDHKGFMIVDRQACLYEHKKKTFELSALRAAGITKQSRPGEKS
jgi:hypothetical protein